MTVDLTQLILQLALAIFAFIVSLCGYVIQRTMKDRLAAAALDRALHNALGAMRQNPEDHVVRPLAKAPVTLADGTIGDLAVGEQYVIDHAAFEAARFRISEDLLRQKLLARIGNAKLAAVTPTKVTLPCP